MELWGNPRVRQEKEIARSLSAATPAKISDFQRHVQLLASLEPFQKRYKRGWRCHVLGGYVSFLPAEFGAAWDHLPL